MYTEVFEELGLSPNEAKIYETLLFSGETNVSSISTKGNVHRRNVYDALERLLEKGLVYKIFQKGGDMFRAVTPNKLLEMVDEKRKHIQKILPRLNQIYETIPTTEAAFIYRGIEGYKNYRRDLERVAEDTYFLGAKALWMSPQIDSSIHERYTSAMKKNKAKYYTIFDYRVQEQLPEAISKIGGEYRILPKEYSTPGVVDMFGDYIVTFTSVDIGNFGEDGMIFVMRNKELAESYKTWFRFIWDFCPKEK